MKPGMPFVVRYDGGSYAGEWYSVPGDGGGRGDCDDACRNSHDSRFYRSSNRHFAFVISAFAFPARIR